jgi:prephenate dehydrogenase
MRIGIIGAGAMGGTLARHLAKRMLNAGPMASSGLRIALAKILDSDYSPHAAIADTLNSARLID